MMTHRHKHSAGGLNILELFTAVGAIILFWLGLKFGTKSMTESFPDLQSAYWFKMAAILTGIISGFIPSAVFVGTCLALQKLLQKQKKKKQQPPQAPQ